MKLLSFQVKKFRNIVDSGEIAVDDRVTCLVGKNEAGKSGLLEALYLFNPAYKHSFDVAEQYPRWLAAKDRRSSDLGEHAPITVTLLLDDADKAIVAASLGDGVLTSDKITVRRTYAGTRNWTTPHNTQQAIENQVAKFPDRIRSKLPRVENAVALAGALEAIESDADDESAPTKEEITEAKTSLKSSGLSATVPVWRRIADILKHQLPQFFRFTAYSTLPGRIDLSDLSSGEQEGTALTSNQTARALISLAGTAVEQLQDEDYELRKGELEAVSIDLTNQVFEYWKQNPDLEVQIDLDKETVEQPNNQRVIARHLDIRLRDKRTGYSNNFSQRSSGFQWFFSFLAAFSEFEDKESPIVLLDEPALTLHGKAQADFLRFINERLAPFSAVLYTTHSPFMVEPGHLERVRIVEDKGPPTGAVATEDILAGDADSLFPLHAALGYDIAQNLFVGPNNLVVEGTSDFIFLTVMSQLCGENDRTTLDDRWRILPAGGATNIPTFVSLIGPHLDTTVFADSNAKGMQRIKNMIEQGLLADSRLILANSVVPSSNADVEDLFTEGDYLKLYNKTYSTQLKVAELPEGDRIVKRLESIRGAEYDHGEVAETLLRKHHDTNFTETTIERFEAIIEAINATIET